MQAVAELKKEQIGSNLDSKKWNTRSGMVVQSKTVSKRD
jgi:hypothetical protein